MTFADTLRNLDYQSLEISDYSRNYILRLLPTLDYYLDLCLRVLRRLPATTHTLVDYGGGHGFLSLLAKRLGIAQVIYIDHNPQGAETVRALSERLGERPDVVLTGDQHTLSEWCRAHQALPDALVGIDVIEHIYRLEPFFDDLFDLNPRMHLLFTTGSNPCNPWVRRRLHRIMRQDERGSGDTPGFRELRRRHIASLRPDLGDAELDRLATLTRGLTYPDIASAIQQPHFETEPSRYNTCDPATGSWTERILPLSTYRRLTASHDATLTVSNGFYNSHRPGPKGLASRLLNLLLLLPASRWLAPFIILETK